MSNNAAIQKEIMAALDLYKSSYSNKDIKLLLSVTDPGFFGFGSGPDEKVFGIEALKLQLERDFAQSGKLSMDFGPMTIAGEGNAAWCAGDCTISAEVGGKWLRLDGRMTAVLRKAGGKWLFAHTHFSVPDLGQQAGQSFPMK
jgi:ketosteroid isomerase-like protein